MSILRFSDGLDIDTSGDYRIVGKRDGLYVVGHGIMCAVDTCEEGQRMIEELRKVRESKD